jgi:hypothetical protein
MGNNVIKFVTTVQGLDQINECIPKPAKAYIPEWFKSIPSNVEGSVKQCPSFPDYFSQGYVIPMWMDTILKHDPMSSQWRVDQAAHNIEKWSAHSNDQFLDFVDPSFNGSPGQFVFKTACPWFIITPPGWSVLQLPLFYNFNKDYSVLPGVIDTDIHHEINQQVLYHGDGHDVMIKRGDPLALYIPFERKKLDYSVGYRSEDEKNKIFTSIMSRVTKFPFSGAYRKMQKERDSSV